MVLESVTSIVSITKDRSLLLLGIRAKADSSTEASAPPYSLPETLEISNVQRKPVKQEDSECNLYSHMFPESQPHTWLCSQPWGKEWAQMPRSRSTLKNISIHRGNGSNYRGKKEKRDRQNVSEDRRGREIFQLRWRKSSWNGAMRVENIETWVTEGKEWHFTWDDDFKSFLCWSLRKERS